MPILRSLTPGYMPGAVFQMLCCLVEARNQHSLKWYGLKARGLNLISFKTVVRIVTKPVPGRLREAMCQRQQQNFAAQLYYISQDKKRKDSVALSTLCESCIKGGLCWRNGMFTKASRGKKSHSL